MQWIHARNLENINPLDLYNILKLRQDIFIIEQDCLYEDMDDVDPVCEHLFLKKYKRVITYARIVPAGKKMKHPSIGRIIVHKEYRGKGYGREIIRKALGILSQRKTEAVMIEAQSHLQTFYESLGFEKISDPYPVDGISHIKMNFQFGI